VNYLVNTAIMLSILLLFFLWFVFFVASILTIIVCDSFKYLTLLQAKCIDFLNKKWR
jgi:hypothetical protein